MHAFEVMAITSSKLKINNRSAIGANMGVNTWNNKMLGKCDKT